MRLFSRCSKYKQLTLFFFQIKKIIFQKCSTGTGRVASTVPCPATFLPVHVDIARGSCVQGVAGEKFPLAKSISDDRLCTKHGVHARTSCRHQHEYERCHNYRPSSFFLSIPKTPCHANSCHLHASKFSSVIYRKIRVEYQPHQPW